MHSIKKVTTCFFRMRFHIGVESLHSFVCSNTGTPMNEAEVEEVPKLLPEDDDVTTSDASHCKLERCLTDGIERRYEFNRQEETSTQHYGNSLS